MSLSQLIAKVAKQLLGAGIKSSQAEAREIVSHNLEISKSELALLEMENFEPSVEQLQAILNMASKRATRVPLQHLIGKSFFRNLELSVGPGVFIPRPETETLVEIALGLDLPDLSSFEVGAGSGAISIALAEEGGFEATAIEISVEASSWATKNIDNYGSKVRLITEDFSNFLPKRRFGLLISNPPYVPTSAVPVDPEVYLHDPQTALYSGADGLDLIRELSLSKNFLLPGGFLLFEHDESQRQAIVELLLNEGWRDVLSHKDLNGRDRFIQAVA